MIDATRHWSGMLPVELLNAIPQSQRHQRLGLIDTEQDWSNLWTAWRQAEPIPPVDFGREVIVFIKNVKYLNQIQLRSVTPDGAVAVIDAQETRSARPIEDQLNCVMFVLPRDGLEAVSDGLGTQVTIEPP